MTEPVITCPNCQSEIRLTESLAAPLVDAERRRAREERDRLVDAAIRKERDQIALEATAKATRDQAAEIGALKENLVPIADVARLFSGYHFRSAIGAYPDGPLRVLQVNDFDRKGRFDAGKLARIQPDFNPAPYLLDEGDVIFLARGGRNWARTTIDAAGMITPGNFYILRPDTDQVDPVYLAWWLNSSVAQRQIGSAQQGSNVRFILLSEFRSLLVPLPPLAQQRQIADLHKLATHEYTLMTQLRDARASLADALALAVATGAATGAASE